MGNSSGMGAVWTAAFPLVPNAHSVDPCDKSADLGSVCPLLAYSICCMTDLVPRVRPAGTPGPKMMQLAHRFKPTVDCAWRMCSNIEPGTGLEELNL